MLEQILTNDDVLQALSLALSILLGVLGVGMRRVVRRVSDDLKEKKAEVVTAKQQKTAAERRADDAERRAALIQEEQVTQLLIDMFNQYWAEMSLTPECVLCMRKMEAGVFRTVRKIQAQRDTGEQSS